jgi:hypothetical protein
MTKIVRYLLLAIVAVSLIWLLLPKGAAERSATESAASATPAKHVAYYFHRTARCSTCLTIEAYAHDVVFQNFEPQLRSGDLLFLPTNVELAGNEHFVKDYDLVAQALVLVEYDGPRVKRWKNLDRIWDLVGDSTQFAQYVHDEVGSFVGSTL